jgi:hypothetical protein
MVWHVHVDIVNWASSADGAAASISAIGGMENKHLAKTDRNSILPLFHAIIYDMT